MTTLVQIKRSTLNVAPTTLEEGELAYSYVSNTLFVGDTANGVMNIGGKYYTDLLDNGSAANGSTTFVRRYANGSAQFQQLDILVAPTANSHVATKEYVDDKVYENISLANLSDVTIVGTAADQNNRIIIGNANGEYISRDVTGNVTISNTGVVVIGSSQVTNSMLAGSISNDKLANANVVVTAGTGLIGGGTVDLGSTITIDVAAGDGISNANGDTVSVDSTVVRTDRNQTINGSITFSNTTYFTSDIDVTGNIYLTGNTTYINVGTLNITDPLIYLASNNDLTDLVDIGFMGGKNTSGTYSHTGLIRHAADGNWYLFDGLADEGHENNIVDVANTTYALLKANLEAQSLNVNSGFANINTTLTVTGNTSLLSNLAVSSNLTVSQNANVTGTLNVGSSLDVTGNVNLISNLVVGGNVNVAGTVNAVSGIFGTMILETVLGVASGGTGVSAFTPNGVFYGGTSSSLSFATGTEGQLLQIASGVPTFAMLDGGSF
jgi:NF-X1-type zinc finger protein NFXL1